MAFRETQTPLQLLDQRGRWGTDPRAGGGENIQGCVLRRSVPSVSLRPRGRQPARLLCPRDFPGKNTGVGCHSLLQGTFPTRDQTRVSNASCPACMHAKSLQSCPTLCDPTDSSPPGSPILGVLQARILEWGAISFSDPRFHKYALIYNIWFSLSDLLITASRFIHLTTADKDFF